MQVILIADFSLPLAFVISALYLICFDDLVDGTNSLWKADVHVVILGCRGKATSMSIE